ncbi:NADH-quinone oxidoreductase subunit J [Starkeya sp. ORNL1]|uniref:complex I subunit 5 family protein n=1 Tax=Starkeya sp. ORNL1 TaxID=2709380 RepID=UPI0014640084|nr:proton-conducting transporter membrane subunit [Starkeya sp. ORNL1]QJP14072.1 NADH-quinone oxidoreductase subunit J [Starkeya sp. ORNL1]
MSGGFLLVLALMLPAVGVAAMFAVPMRAPERIAWLVYPPTLAVVIAIAVAVGRSGEALSYTLGGWAPPLGLMLRADGASAVMMVMSAIILGLVGISACMQFHTPDGVREARVPFTFWALLLALWSALNLVFLAQDLFTLFVALELLTFAAVPLVCLNGKADTLQAALRYLLFALVGSVFYLLGVALIYGAYGMLDFAALRTVARDDLATSLAIALMVGGLMAKTAVFPVHLWLPPAHAGAPAPASAVLSALVIKAPFFLIVRLWFDLLPAQGLLAANMLAALGAASILFCSVLALRQARLKLMIAYSTVAQVGYLFLMFPLATSDAPWETLAWSGGLLQLVSHAFAKAAMFVAAGLIAEALGHDRIDDLAGAAKAAPISVFAFALAGLSLMGLPPSGGFNAKVMLISGAVMLEQWWIAVVILAGGVLAAGYVFRVIGKATADPAEGVEIRPVARSLEAVPLALAICALVIGFVPLQPFAYLAIGRATGVIP